VDVEKDGMDKITNEEILNKVGEKRQLISVTNRKKIWIGHVLRDEGLLREVVEGRMEGKRVRGRPRKGRLYELMVESYGIMKRKAESSCGAMICGKPGHCQGHETGYIIIKN